MNNIKNIIVQTGKRTILPILFLQHGNATLKQKKAYRRLLINKYMVEYGGKV
jgi:hypothetical protein